MELAATLMTIYILGGGAQPGITVIPQDALPSSECSKWVARQEGREPVVIDPVSRRPVIMTFHTCVLTDVDQEVKRWVSLAESMK